MFRRLRNRLIIINVVVTTIVLAVAFSTIYTVAHTKSTLRPEPMREMRGPGPGAVQEMPSEMSQAMTDYVMKDRRTALDSLLWSLLAVGGLVEVAVVLLSYGLAEAAIKPVKEAYEKQKIFIANASHELKTPLAAMAANLEAAEITDNRWIDNVAHEVKWMTQLNNELLALSRADNMGVQVRMAEDVSLEVIAKGVMRDFEARAQEKGMKMTLRKAGGHKIALVKADVVQILTILIDNAVKYGKKKVICTVEKGEIWIENDGAKIAPEERERIFERFYQVDKSKKAEGAGLGLAIAAVIAKNNGWKIEVESDKMTRFTLKFKS